MIKGPFDFMKKGYSMYVAMLPGFGEHRHCCSGDMFLIYHVISRDHVFKTFFDFIGGILS